MKRIIVLGMALIMLFSVAMLGIAACDGGENDPNLGPCGYAVCICEKDTPMPNPCEQDTCVCEELLLAHMTDAIETLEAYVYALDNENFTTQNWALALERAKEAELAINEATNKAGVDAALASVKLRINRLQIASTTTYFECEENDLLFRLSVTVDRTEARVGEAVEVASSLENLSGRELSLYRRHVPVFTTQLLAENRSPSFYVIGSIHPTYMTHFSNYVPSVDTEKMLYVVASNSYNNLIILLSFDSIFDGLWPGTFGGNWVETAQGFKYGLIQIFIHE